MPHLFSAASVLALLALAMLLGACASGPSGASRNTDRQDQTLTATVDQLLAGHASRLEVIRLLGPPTGYTRRTLSYMLAGHSGGTPTVLSFPARDMAYDDPDNAGRGPLRWVLHFDDLGLLHRYELQLEPASSVYDGWRDRRDAAGLQSGFVAGFTSIACDPVEHCVAVGGGGLIVETTDGGASWVTRDGGANTCKPIPLVVLTLTDITMPVPDRLWITGYAMPFPSHGVILHGSDRLTTWGFQYKGTFLFPKPALTSVSFVDAKSGWAVGNDGTILATQDGGQSWNDQHSGTDKPLLAVHFCDAQAGWAVGIEGTIVTTADGGASWAMQESGVTSKLFDIASVDCLRAWAVGDDGLLLHTMNGGRTWRPGNAGVDVPLGGVFFVNALQGWAVGGQGTILHSSDGGQSWTRQLIPSREFLNDVAFTDEKHGWISGTFGTILATRDGGETWTPQCLVYDCAGTAANQFYWQPWLR